MNEMKEMEKSKEEMQSGNPQEREPELELEVLISTFGKEGLARLSAGNLPMVKGVGYLVSCQCPGHDSLPIPPRLLRDDIRVIFTPTVGLSVNRNNCLEHATARLCMIADDDLTYIPEAFETIIKVFNEHPDLAVATFIYTLADGSTEKQYPAQSFSLTERMKGYFVTSFEIVFKRESVINSGICFNRRFGLGAPVFTSGEEELWIYDLLRKGLAVHFFPIVICRHEQGTTTGLRMMRSPGVLRAQGAVIKRLYPHTALLRVILKGWRVSAGEGLTKRLRLFGALLPPLLYGWWQASVHPRKLFET